MPFLLDVNVLIARTDPGHVHHERVVRWERDRAGELFVTCPLVENGFVRIYGHPRYPGGPGSPAEALIELRHIRALPAHRFVADDLTLADRGLFLSLEALTPRQVSDVYLLALAARHGIHFATLDSQIPAERVAQGHRALHVIAER